MQLLRDILLLNKGTKSEFPPVGGVPIITNNTKPLYGTGGQTAGSAPRSAFRVVSRGAFPSLIFERPDIPTFQSQPKARTRRFRIVRELYRCFGYTNTTPHFGVKQKKGEGAKLSSVHGRVPIFTP
jgi:hypothetical protein